MATTRRGGCDRWAEWKPRGEPEPVVEHDRPAAAPERDEEPAEWKPAPYVTRDMRRWKRDGAEDAVPTSHGAGHGAAQPVSDERAAVPHAAPAETRDGRTDDGDDIGERARRGAEECEKRLRDLEEIRATLRDPRDAEADRDDEADRREAEESLTHDADVPPARCFGDLDDIIARRRELGAAPERDEERQHPSAAELVDEILRWDDDVPADAPSAPGLIDDILDRPPDDDIPDHWTVEDHLAADRDPWRDDDRDRYLELGC